MADDSLVVFTPSGRRGRFPSGTPLLAAARRLGVDLDSVCGGRGICTRCQIRVSEGEFAKHGIVSAPDHLTEPTDREQRQRRTGRLKEGHRLSCQACVAGDLVADVPETSQVHRQIVRKRADARNIRIDPLVRPMYVEVPPPDLALPAAHLRRLKESLREAFGVRVTEAEVQALRRLHPTLEAGGYRATAFVRDGRRLVDIRSGYRDRVYGLAVDVGSTTLAVHLCDLLTGEVVASLGRMNPQIRFGEDLMSRVSFAMMNEDGAAEMTEAVREALDELAAEAAAAAGVDPADVFEIAIAGNPVMHHLLLGLDPAPLGFAPFALATDEGTEVAAADIGLRRGAGEAARAYVLPCIAGHVGADAAGVVLSEMPYRKREVTLIVDVGTNAELVLGNRDRLLAASSPTGPAFEGAQLSCGQRAAPGVIERVRIDPVTLEPRYRVIGDERWSDEPGFESAPSGICGSGIVEAIAELFLAGIVRGDGTIDGALAERSPRIVRTGRTFTYVIRTGEPEIAITQNDVRQIQLAKAALYAGARLLMDRMGIDAVDRVTLAGAFGSQIDPKYALILGMVPDCEPGRVTSAGNAAGTGARIALLNRRLRRELEREVRRIEKVETAVEARFQEHFVDAMAIPHASAPYEKLRAAVALPPPPMPAAPLVRPAPPRRPSPPSSRLRGFLRPTPIPPVENKKRGRLGRFRARGGVNGVQSAPGPECARSSTSMTIPPGPTSFRLAGGGPTARSVFIPRNSDSDLHTPSAVHRDASGSLGATVPDFPGCFSVPTTGAPAAHGAPRRSTTFCGEHRDPRPGIRDPLDGRLADSSDSARTPARQPHGIPGVLQFNGNDDFAHFISALSVAPSGVP